MTTPSFWQATEGTAPKRPRLTHSLDVEFAIVGAGIAGLSLALHLASAGREVALVEATVPGSGALGASAGIVAPQLIRTTPGGVVARLGNELGAAWLRLIGESGGHLFNLIRSHDIACDARSFGFIAPARKRGAMRRLQKTVEDWKPYRRDLSVIDAQEVTALTGTRGYSAAIVDASGGGVNPLALALGLAERAVEAGAALYHHTPAVAVERAGTHWRVRTGEGEAVARHVVLCANGGNHRLHPQLRETVLPMRIHELTTTPLSQAMRERVLPHGHALTDLELDIFSIRWIEGDRLLTYYPAGDDVTIADVEAAVNTRLRTMLSYAEPVTISHLWEGLAWMNSSLLPRIVALDDGLLAVQACNGRGIATNAIVGREVARTLLAPGRYRPGIAFEKPRAVRGFALARYLPNMLLNGARAAAIMTSRLK